MVDKEGLYGRSLVGRKGKDIGEAAAGEDDGFASFFGLGYGGAGLDLGRTNGRNVRATARERRVEFASSAIVVCAVRVDTLTSVAGYTIVSRGIDDGRAFIPYMIS